MPTEEVFTAPLRDGIDGVVYAALPLVHNGNIIENFHFVIKDGKIVEAHAEKGEDILKAAIAEDEGAAYFGRGRTRSLRQSHFEPEDSLLQHALRQKMRLPPRLR